MTSENDLIRRGDAIAVVGRNVLGSQTAVAAIAALPAVVVSQPADPVVKADSCHPEQMYLICKHGGYYRPNCQGYTSSIHEAGRYTLAEAERETHPNGPDGPRDGMSYISDPLASHVSKTQKTDHDPRAAIDTQPDPRDAVIARLVKAIENANDYDQDCECVSCTGLTLAIAAAKGGAA